MGLTDYEYRGLLASTWDLLRADSPSWSDRGFYLDLIARRGQPVLDVGCGTGRLLLDFLQQGIDIEGVDVSPEMLDLCREKADRMGLIPALYRQPMEALGLPRRYRTILVPSSSFQLVLEPASARAALRRFWDHLLPGGVLVMPFLVLWRPGEPAETTWQIKTAARDDGTVINRRSRSRYEPAAQLEHTEDIYEVIRDGVMVTSQRYVRSPATRWYAAQEALDLYAESGFTEIAAYSGFSFQAMGSHDTLFTVEGTRPPD